MKYFHFKIRKIKMLHLFKISRWKAIASISYTLQKIVVTPCSYASFHSKFTSQEKKKKLSISFKHQDSTKNFLRFFKCLTWITRGRLAINIHSSHSLSDGKTSNCLDIMVLDEIQMGRPGAHLLQLPQPPFLLDHFSLPPGAHLLHLPQPPFFLNHLSLSPQYTGVPHYAAENP